MNSNKLFNRFFRSLEATLNLENKFHGTHGEKFEKLYEMCHGNEFAQNLEFEVNHRVKMLDRKIKLLAKIGTPAESIDYLEFIAEDIFYKMLSSVIFRYIKNSKPKIHHWLPKCYSSRFKVATESEIYAVVRNASGNLSQKMVDHNYFTHKPEDNKGYYHLSVENFYSRLESCYSNSFKRLESTKKLPKIEQNYIDIMSLLSLGSFFVCQSVRHPHPDSMEFKIGSIAGTVDAIVDRLGVFDKAFLNFLNSEHVKLVFTPYFPSRIRKHADNTYSMLFPSSRNSGLLISTRQVPKRDLVQVFKKTNISVINYALKRKVVLYGLRANEIQRLVNQK